MEQNPKRLRPETRWLEFCSAAAHASTAAKLQPHTANKCDEVATSHRCSRSGLISRIKRSLFDNFIGAILQRLRHGDAEGLCGLEVDEQLDFACLLHRQVGGLLALENAADIPSSEAVRVYDAAPDS